MRTRFRSPRGFPLRSVMELTLKKRSTPPWLRLENEQRKKGSAKSKTLFPLLKMQGYSNRRVFMNDEKITKREVSSTEMLQSIIAHFGPRAPFVENTIYNLMDMLSEDYQGGSWKYFELSNGGFYMSPTSEVNNEDSRRADRIL